MLSPLQEKLLEMLDWFHQYCVNNHIRYYVCAGTMLGAMRHKGFIPWDDDIDLIIPRPDYERLIRLFNKQIEHYILETPYSGDDFFPYSYAKLYDTNTTMTEHLRRDCKRGISIDVFPLDGIGNSISEAKKNYEKFNRIQNFALTQICAVRNDRSKLKNLAITISRLIPEKFVDIKKLTIKMDKVSSSFGYENNDYVMNFTSTYRLKDVLPKYIYGDPVLYPFEGIMVYGVEKPNEYLTHLYGDWKKLPPKEKRHSAHDFEELNLEKSYIQ